MWGGRLEWLETVLAPQLAAKGLPCKPLDARPKIPPHLIPVWDAYASLERDRPLTMGGPGPIPFSSIDAYARRYGIDDLVEFDRFRRLIMAMDSQYLSHVADELAKDAKKGQKR